MSTTKSKPLYVLDILRELTDSQHRLSAQDIATELTMRGVPAERKGIYRDIDALIDHGEDVHSTKQGYYLGIRNYELAELRLLISAVQAASFISPERSRQLMMKLASELSDFQSRELLLQSNIGGIKCRGDEIFRTIEAVNLAIATRRCISFTYVKRDLTKRDVIQRSGQRYVVSPYAMIWVHDKYYLVSNMESRRDLTHFRLDRMKNVDFEECLWRSFTTVSEYTRVFDAADYAKKCVNMFGGEIGSVSIRCYMDMIGEVLDRFGDDVLMRRTDNDKFTVSLRIAMSDGFLAWASQFADRVEILSPAALRQKQKQRLADALKLYE